jgi:hypothetical protein
MHSSSKRLRAAREERAAKGTINCTASGVPVKMLQPATHI